MGPVSRGVVGGKFAFVTIGLAGCSLILNAMRLVKLLSSPCQAFVQPG